MKEKYLFCKYAVIFMSAAIFLTGCYSKDNLVHRDPHQEKAGDITSNENVNKFLSSVRKVNGEAESKYQMARYFQKQNKHKIAIEELKEVILIDPFFPKAYNALGVSYDQLREFKNAIHSYKIAIKLDPNLDYAYNNLGFSFLLSGDYDRAIDAFRKAITLDQQNKRFRNNLGLAYAKKGAYELALEQFRLAGDEASANDKLAQILFKEGKYEIARKYSANSFEATTSNHSTPPVSSVNAEKGSRTEIIRKSIRQDPKAVPKQDLTAAQIRPQDFTSERVKGSQLENADISEKPLSSPKYNNEANRISQKEPRENKDFTVEVEIEISNGNGVNGMANRFGNYLIKKGFKVKRLKNAKCFNHETTKIFYYKSHAQDVSRLLKEIPVKCDKRNLIELKQADRNIKILIGKDMIPYDSLISSGETVKDAS